MERKREDRRVRITKQAIQESLIELMPQYPLSRISVKMICETADINRSTFYAHYKDQYALLDAVQQTVISDIKREVFSTSFFNGSDGAFEAFLRLLKYGKANAALIKVLLSEGGGASFQHALLHLAQEKIVDEMSRNNQISAHAVPYLKHFMLGGMLSVMRRWLDQDCADPPELVAEMMVTLIVYGTSGLLSAE